MLYLHALLALLALYPHFKGRAQESIMGTPQEKKSKASTASKGTPQEKQSKASKRVRVHHRKTTHFKRLSEVPAGVTHLRMLYLLYVVYMFYAVPSFIHAVLSNAYFFMRCSCIH